ncbi:MAG TPA: BamA/TamA family outer membrane protein [Longimicrobiales bacterium]|nr:BamA/TamA family outer membrane protein [Longimicrobiales bacterium]
MQKSREALAVRWKGAFLLAALALLGAPLPGGAQYFGRNKVQYDKFEFVVLKTPHFDYHYYPVMSEAVGDAARMGERWYERFARTFQHEFEAAKPIVLYADHPDFEQTNTLSGFIGEGTGGVTESMKDRLIMPLGTSYWDTDHVLGHEMVHMFQFNIAQSRQGGGMQGLMTLPLWLVEGMAEYLSVGRDDPLTAMWIRDAIRRDEFPTIKEMTEGTKFFPYRFGQSLMAYIGGTYGDDAIIQIFRRSLRVGFEPAFAQVTGMPTDTLSVRWKEQVAKEYLPLMEGRSAPGESGQLLLAPSTGSGEQNVSPSLSPDGRYLAFLSEKDLFSVDLYLADAATGKILRKLYSANSDPKAEALRYIDSSGTWSPDGRFFAFVITSGGDNEMVIIDVESGNQDQVISFPGLGAVNNPAWSPDGRKIVFSGTVGGITDLWLHDVETGRLVQATDDRFSDLQPTWSPDGRTIAFTSDRGPETNFAKLTYSQFQLALMDVASFQVQVLPVFGNVKHINPQYAPDGRSLYFISDQDGFSDVYRLDLQTGDASRVTKVATAVSGITYLSPALSVAAQTGRIAFSVFDELQFHIIGLEPTSGTLVARAERAEDQPGRKLPPANPERFSRVETYLADAETGLLPEGSILAADAEAYRPSLSLDYLGQPSIGVGTDSYGTYVGGGTSAYFSDMLGDRVLGVALQAQGTFKDIGGQAFYQNLEKRWNWGVGLGRIPYLMGFYDQGIDEVGPYLGMYRYRIFMSSAAGQLAYPFNSVQRVEFSAGATRYSYDIEVDKYYLDDFGRIIDFSRESLNDSLPDPMNLVETSVAFVGDNSFFGFVGPIRGGRYRLEVQQTWGSADYTTVIADWRRYFSPIKLLTVGMRGLHYGRYGITNEESNSDGFGMLQPLFLGYETLVRGYAYESFTPEDCQASEFSTCPAFERLQGQRIGVASLELRVPFIGVEQYGVLNFPFIPTELVAFADAGAAWEAESPATWEFSRNSGGRVPVFSTGVSARFNILGVMILEAYYAYPFQRPAKGWHWGFSLAPAW